MVRADTWPELRLSVATSAMVVLVVACASATSPAAVASPTPSPVATPSPSPIASPSLPASCWPAATIGQALGQQFPLARQRKLSPTGILCGYAADPTSNRGTLIIEFINAPPFGPSAVSAAESEQRGRGANDTPTLVSGVGDGAIFFQSKSGALEDWLYVWRGTSRVEISTYPAVPLARLESLAAQLLGLSSS
jgi:hypothetical protein